MDTTTMEADKPIEKGEKECHHSWRGLGMELSSTPQIKKIGAVLSIFCKHCGKIKVEVK